MDNSPARVVVLSDAEPVRHVAEPLSESGRSPEWYTTFEALLDARPLSTIAVLVVLSHPLPKGILLVTLGRMTLEYPAMKKVVVMDAAPPLPIAEYLTSCGVDMVWNESEGDSLERLATVVDGMKERSRWITS